MLKISKNMNCLVKEFSLNFIKNSIEISTMETNKKITELQSVLKILRNLFRKVKDFSRV